MQARRQHPDLQLMPIIFIVEPGGGRDGELREVGSQARLPLVQLTNTLIQIHELSKAAGPDDFATHPESFQVLGQQLERGFGARGDLSVLRGTLIHVRHAL